MRDLSDLFVVKNANGKDEEQATNTVKLFLLLSMLFSIVILYVFGNLRPMFNFSTPKSIKRNSFRNSCLVPMILLRPLIQPAITSGELNDNLSEDLIGQHSEGIAQTELFPLILPSEAIHYDSQYSSVWKADKVT